MFRTSSSLNLDTVFVQLDEIAASQTAALAKALEEEATMVARVSQELVPVEHGTLRDSCLVTNPKIEGDRHVSVSVMYTAEYSAIVHEDLEAKHPHGGGPKFLERATDMTAGGRTQRIVDSMKAAQERIV